MADSHSWTWEEAAHRLGVSRQTLTRHRHGNEIILSGDRRIPCYTFGGKYWFVPKAALAKFLGEPVEVAS